MPRDGLYGEVHGYHVFTDEDDVLVARGKDVQGYLVAGLGTFIREREAYMRLGWGKLPDFEVLYIYDRRDGFGYAINLDDAGLSEWGYAPFAAGSTP